MKQFPFTAVVGMEQAKRSLIFHAIDPRLAGTLFMGHRGCAKSTLSRAFAELLRHSDGNAPFVEVPLGTTEDRLLGSVNAEKLVSSGKWEARSGLIEQANGGVLYIDEINLLPDHLSDFILDSAATGQYRMERDGLTRVVESRYILIGSMNPDEGDLRPQLSDRFAHGVFVRDDFSAEERVEIVRQRMSFEDDPDAFIAKHAGSISDLRKKINAARERLKGVEISDSDRADIANYARDHKFEGLRAELAVIRTARCAAVWDGRTKINNRDIEEAWHLCLGHRLPNSEAPQKQIPPTPPAHNNHKSVSNAAPQTPRNPVDAQSTPKGVHAFSPQIQESIIQWMKEPQSANRQSSVKQTATVTSRVDEGGRISWIDSLKTSSLKGWKSGAVGLELRYHHPILKSRLWIFLDASRSTGAQSFLAQTRDMLGGLAMASKSARFHLLVLKDGVVRWRVNNSTRKALLKALAEIHQAGGKSCIDKGLNLLNRSLGRRGFTQRDRILICSDGLVSPRQGELPAVTIYRLRNVLQQLAQNPLKIAWLHPIPPRGFASWLGKLCDGLPIRLISV